MRQALEISSKLLPIALVMVFGLTRSLSGQITPALTSVLGQQESPSSQDAEIDVSVDAASTLGTLTYVPDHWGELHLSMKNGGSSPQELLCTSYFGDQSSLQFGRRVWLPAHSRLSLTHPILIPDSEQFPEGRGTVHTLVLDDSEVAIQSRSGRRLRDRDLLISTAERHTAIVAGWQATDEVPQDVIDLVVACRVYQGINNRVTYLSGQFLPADETNLDYLDHIVLAEDRLVDDLAALTALRRWVHAGGRLWIMLDRTGPEILERLVGDEFEGSVVDQVELTSVQVDDPLAANIPDAVPAPIIEFDNPIRLSRAAISGMTVWNTVNGWPVALTRRYGEGRLLVTTLGARGWTKPAPPAPVREPDKDETPEEKQARERRALEMKTDFVPTSPMEDIAPFIFARRDAPPLPNEELESFAQEFISYEVPSGSLIIGSMFGFLGLLAVVGTGLWKLERLEHFGWIGSLLAVMFGGLFLWVGLTSRHGTAETIASVQLAQSLAGTEGVRTRGAVAIYRAEGGQARLGTTHGGKLLPEKVGEGGTIDLMVTSDLGSFYWDGLKQPPGMAVYEVATSRTNPTRLDASATVDEQGIVGRCSDALSTGSDVLLVTRRGRMGATMSGDGSFTANVDQVLEQNEYLDVDFVDDVRDRRQRMLLQLFNNREWQSSLDAPHLLLWVNNWDNGFQFGEGLERQGDTLVIAPLGFEQPSPGTEVIIPSPLLDYVTRQPPDGSPASGFWDDGNQEWQERSSASTTWLSIQIPPAFLPLEARQVRLEISVSGLMGHVEALGVKNGEIVSLADQSDPVGTVVFEIEDPEALIVSDRGELPLGISAGVVAESEASQSTSGGSSWRIHSLSIQLSGITRESTSENTEE